MQSSLHSLKLEKACVWQGRLTATKNKSVNFKKKGVENILKRKELNIYRKIFITILCCGLFSKIYSTKLYLKKHKPESRLLSILEFEIQPSLGHIWNSNIYWMTYYCLPPAPNSQGIFFFSCEKLIKLKFVKNLTKPDWTLPSSRLLFNRETGAKVNHWLPPVVQQ